MMPLTLLSPGEKQSIKRIGGNPPVKKHLESLGFITGENITLISTLCSNVIVNVKGTRVAISRELAQKIMV